MFLGPQLAPLDVAGIAERTLKAPQPPNSGRLSAASQIKQDTSAAADITIDFADISPGGSDLTRLLALRQGPMADLIRVEAILQVARNSLVAIEALYEGIRELTVLALDETLSDVERTELQVAFQKLVHIIEDIVPETTFADEKLFIGAEQPVSANGINLSAGSEQDAPSDTLIPSITVPVRLAELGKAPLLTAKAANIALQVTENVPHLVRDVVSSIDHQRGILKQTYAEELESAGHPRMETALPASSSQAQELARSLAGRILGAEKGPVPHNEKHLRVLLQQTEGPHQSLRSNIDKPPLLTEDVKIVPREETRPSIQAQIPISPSQAGPLVNNGFLFNEEITRHDDGGARMTAPDAASALLPRGAAGAFVTPVIASVSIPEEALAPFRDGADEFSPLLQIMPLAKSSVGPTGQPPQAAGDTRKPDSAFSPPPLPDLLMDNIAVPNLEAMLGLNQAKNQVVTEIRLVELSKVGEMDAARRASGLIHQVREADARLDAGITIVRTIYDAPTGELQDFGASVPVEPGAFVAELLRADNILLVADVAIEQIDLHLDYMGGLAEEAATKDSRDRDALDEIFQAVKSNIIDSMAQTTEAQGEKILAGGDGPHGEFVIKLFEGGAAIAAHSIVIPSMRMEKFSPDLFRADIRTSDSAETALTYIDSASADAVKTRDMIAEQRSLIRQLVTLEINQSR